MAETLKLSVITPERIVLDLAVDSVRLPAVSGSLGILPRHAPLVAALEAGLLAYRESGAEQVLFVSEGFAQTDGRAVRVVCEAAERAGEIDLPRAREAEARAQELLARKGDGAVDVPRAELALRRASKRLEVSARASGERVRP